MKTKAKTTNEVITKTEMENLVYAINFSESRYNKDKTPNNLKLLNKYKEELEKLKEVYQYEK